MLFPGRSQPPSEAASTSRRFGAVTCALAAMLLVGSRAAAAAPEPSVLTSGYVPVAQVFTFLFLTLGPIKIIGPFAQVTKGADNKLARRIALLATLFSSVALLFAALVGDSFLESYGISVPLLALSGGLILFLVALINILKQFDAPVVHAADLSDLMPPPPINVAMVPLAFPTIVTPYGIAALVVFLALAPDVQSKLMVGAIMAAILLLNLVVMLFSRRFMSVLGVVLPILGAVLGIVQVALGLKIIRNSLAALGLL